MTDESRKAFEAAMRGIGWGSTDFRAYLNGHYWMQKTNDAYQVWRLRDAEIAALKARVKELKSAFIKIQMLPQHAIVGEGMDLECIQASGGEWLLAETVIDITEEALR